LIFALVIPVLACLDFLIYCYGIARSYVPAAKRGILSLGIGQVPNRSGVQILNPQPFIKLFTPSLTNAVQLSELVYREWRRSSS
jgi:hypothetical protein